MIKADPTTADPGMDYNSHQCQRLWKHVLTQACKDASYIGDRNLSLLYREQAQAWLLSGSLDLQLVCENADVHIERVTTWAKQCQTGKDWKKETFLWSRPRQRWR
jgi:hypothetical protein